MMQNVPVRVSGAVCGPTVEVRSRNPNIPIRCEGRWAREIGVCVMEKCRIE
jgi:hypothetical protein